MNRRDRLLPFLIAGALSALLLADLADARVGGGRSFGSRGGRSLSPSRPAYTPYRAAPAPAPSPAPSQRPANPGYSPPPRGEGFLRSLGGGLAGGLLGGLLFGSLFGGVGHAGGMGGIGGSGVGLLEIALLGGLAYLAYRMLFANRPAAAPAGPPGPRPADLAPAAPFPAGGAASDSYDAEAGVAGIRALDPGFDPRVFCDDTATALFFQIQGAFASRDLAPASDLLTPEVRAELQADADALRARGQFNRLENVAVRKVEIVEAWQEGGRDFVTVLFRANLLDYVTDESGALVSGSRTAPVLFEEYWTFTRPAGPGGWKLSAISQP